MTVTGTYINGSIVLDQPLAVANGEQMSLVVTEPDRCGDGSTWPASPAEIDAWCRRVEELPALFVEDLERLAFETRLEAMRQDQTAAFTTRGEKVAALFRE